jgi:hypothetical protein
MYLNIIQYKLGKTKTQAIRALNSLNGAKLGIRINVVGGGVFGGGGKKSPTPTTTFIRIPKQTYDNQVVLLEKCVGMRSWRGHLGNPT